MKLLLSTGTWRRRLGAQKLYQLKQPGIMLRSRFANNDSKEGISTNIPQTKKRASKSSIFLKKLFKILSISFFILYIVIPIVFFYSTAVRRQAVFLNYVSLSRIGNLSDPPSFGIKCAKNMFLTSDSGVKLGMWHILPDENCDKNIETFDSKPIVLYIHGNSGTRAGGHRIGLYKLLSAHNYHVVTFDYRGYGDSSNIGPTANGLIEDSKNVFKWISQRVDSSKIIIWGHSLGTAVSVSLMQLLAQENIVPFSLILEAPFTKVTDAAKHYPLTIFHRYMPYFDEIFIKSLAGEDTELDSINKIADIKSPLLILHAEDDAMVPVDFGRQLFKKAIQGPNKKIKFIEFSKDKGYGHKGIYRDPELANYINKFIKVE